MGFIKLRVKDSSMLHLIEKFLKAGYIDDGIIIHPEKGTPQGSILSPLLSNIFLHHVSISDVQLEWFPMLSN